MPLPPNSRFLTPINLSLTTPFSSASDNYFLSLWICLFWKFPITGNLPCGLWNLASHMQHLVSMVHGVPCCSLVWLHVHCMATSYLDHVSVRCPHGCCYLWLLGVAYCDHSCMRFLWICFPYLKHIPRGLISGSYDVLVCFLWNSRKSKVK